MMRPLAFASVHVLPFWWRFPVGGPLAVLGSSDNRSLALVLGASAAAAFLSRIVRGVVLPTVVLGILLGPQALGWATAGQYVQFLANLGLAVLFLFAGLEVVEKRVQREAIVRGSAGWALSLILGLAAGYALHAAGLGAAASTEATSEV